MPCRWNYLHVQQVPAMASLGDRHRSVQSYLASNTSFNVNRSCFEWATEDVFYHRLLGNAAALPPCAERNSMTSSETMVPVSVAS